MTTGRGRNVRDVKPNVHRVLKLKDGTKTAKAPSSPSTPQGDMDTPSRGGFRDDVSGSVVLEQLQADLVLQRDDIDRIDSAAYQVVSSFDSAVSRIDHEMDRLNGTMRDLQRDIDDNREALAPVRTDLEAQMTRANDDTKSLVEGLGSRIKSAADSAGAARERADKAKSGVDTLRADLQAARRDMRTLQGEMTALKKEVAAAKREAPSPEAVASKEEQQKQAREIAVLKSEMRQMRETMKQQAQEQEKWAKRRPDPAPIPASVSHSPRELEILSSSITRLATRTNQVDSLEMKFDLFEPRMQRLEGRMDAVEGGSGSRGGPTATRQSYTEDDAYRHDPDPDDNHYPSQAQPRHRKRQRKPAEAEALEPEYLFTPSKRPAYSPVDSGHGTGSGTQSSPPDRSIPVFPRQSKNNSPGKSSITSSSNLRLTKTGAVDKRYTKQTARRSRSGNDLDSIYAPPEDSP